MGQGRAPFDTLVLTKGDAIGSENLNWYARCGSSIPWHSDDEPLFGDQSDPKVILSMSPGSSVDFRVRSRGNGDLLVMDGPAHSEHEQSTS